MIKLERYDVVSKKEVQSLVKAEWNVIHTGQNSVSSVWRSKLGIKRFPDTCCGVLFKGDTAFACNGHWIMKTRVCDYLLDPSVECLFYNYVDDEVCENVNPFADIGVDVESMFGVLQEWKQFNLKVRIQDILQITNDYVSLVRDRRLFSFHAGYDCDTKELGVRLSTKKGVSELMRIPVYSCGEHGYPEFSVNLSYLYKILEIAEEFYHVVDLSFNGTNRDPIIIKAKNPQRNKPDFRFALGQYII